MAFNDPIAYFLTWSCYGVRLHGDPRGSVSEGFNTYGKPFRPPDLVLEAFRADQLLEPPFLIDARQRGCISASIDDCAAFRNWRVFTRNIRTNHIHLVVAAADEPGRMMGAFKSRASRLLREASLIGGRNHVWADGGSKKWLFTPVHVDDACEYVRERQGPDLPIE